MKQSRTMSILESIANVVVGFAVSVLTQLAALPMLGVQLAFTDNILLGGVFTAISIVRSFALRRLFEAIRTRNHCSACEIVMQRKHS